MLFDSFTKIFSGFGKRKSKLTNAEQELIKSMGFDIALIQELKQFASCTFNQRILSPDSDLNYKDEQNYFEFTAKNLSAISFSKSKSDALMIIKLYREKLEKKGYFIYISDDNFDRQPDDITILKTNDKYDLLRFEGTNGCNYDIFVEDIIDKLIEWDNSYGFDFLLAGADSLEIELYKLPPDIEKFANEVYEFCPDIVDQGTETIEELIKDIERRKKVFLWWD